MGWGGDGIMRLLVDLGMKQSERLYCHTVHACGGLDRLLQGGHWTPFYRGLSSPIIITCWAIRALLSVRLFGDDVVSNFILGAIK